MSIGPFEILLVLAILTIIVGPRRITNMARSLGRGVGDFVTELGEKKAGRSKQTAIGDDGEDVKKQVNNPSEESGER